MQTVQVDGFAQWRNVARALLAAGVEPHDVHWAHEQQSSLPIGQADAADQALVPDARREAVEHAVPGASAPRMSRALIEQLELAGRHNNHDRWALLYRIAWRATHGEPEAANQADPDGARLAQLANHVRHEIHRMKAFLRFREPPAGADGPLVAWFEPEHAVLDAVAPHFAERLGTRAFVIETPQARACWDGQTMHYESAAPGRRFEAPPPADADAAWEAYYRSTFNPSRINPSMLVRQMPTRYWKNLPEARLIPGLIEQVATGARQHAAAPLSTTRRSATIPAQATGSAPDPLKPDDTPLQDCRRCELWRNATQAVSGEGPADARIVLVGEQPGDEEDLRGRPFIGPAGQMLNDAIAAAGLQRERVFLTNAVKHFKWEPRGKRRLHKTPGQKEIEACNIWLRSELSTLAAPVVVSLGATALAAVHRAADRSKPLDSLTKLIGTSLRLGDRWLVPTFHPSYVLRLPEPAQREAAFGRIVDALREAVRLAEATQADVAQADAATAQSTGSQQPSDGPA